MEKQKGWETDTIDQWLDAGLTHKQIRACYYAQITALDDQFGRILGALHECGAAQETIVLFTADHGDMLFSQGRTGKEVPWEESIRVPFLIRWPRHIPSGRVCEELISLVDVTPTLLGLAGIQQPSMHGADLSEVMLNRPFPGRDSVFIMNIAGSREWRGVRTRRYTYAFGVDRREWQLYDNERDPFQLSNLADHPDYAELRRQLRAKVEEWLEYADDPCLPGIEYARRLNWIEEWNAKELRLQAAAQSKIAAHAPKLQATGISNEKGDRHE